MTNYILKYTGDKQPDIPKMTALLSVCHVHILDDSLLPKIILIALNDSQLSNLQRDLEDEWFIYPERMYQIPDSRQKIKKPLKK